MIVDFRKQQREQHPIHIDGTVVEKLESFKLLGVHITDKLIWSTHTDSVVKKAQQRGLVWQLHRPQPQGSQEGGAICTTHSPGSNYLPSRHLQPPMSRKS
jgi:hypothetical protein